MKLQYLTATLLVLFACGWVGCARSTDSTERSATGTEYLLTEEPGNAMSVLKCRERLEEDRESQQVTIVGRIDGLSRESWDRDRAAFMVADLSLPGDAGHVDEASKHDADQCPYCQRKQQQELAGSALVEVIDAEGKVPSTDVRQLLGVTEGQTVLVRGTATINTLGVLVVRTNEIFVKSAGN